MSGHLKCYVSKQVVIIDIQRNIVHNTLFSYDSNDKPMI